MILLMEKILIQNGNGNFKYGFINGNGKFIFNSGDFYERNYENNIKNGEGKYFFKMEIILME